MISTFWHVIKMNSTSENNDNNIFLFKEFKMVKNGTIDKVIFSTNGD